MQPEALFGLALGITPPWEVTEVSFTKEANRLDITIGFQRGATFACPVCGTPSPVHDTTEKEWRILAYFESTLTSGFLEEINSFIQSAKTLVRGYRNLDNLIAIAYIIAGKLTLSTRFSRYPLETTKSRLTFNEEQIS